MADRSASRPGMGKRARGDVKSGRRRARKDARAAIITAARDVLAEHGYEGLTIDQVMARADLSRTIFYRHFEDRGGLLVALWTDFVTALTDAASDWLAGDPSASLEESLRANIEVFAADADVFIAVCDEAPSDPEVRAAYEAGFWGFVDAIESRIRALHPEIADPRGTAEVLVSIDERLWYRRFRSSTDREVIDDTYRVTLDAWKAVLGE